MLKPDSPFTSFGKTSGGSAGYVPLGWGLPQNHLSIALLTFNIGVEIGQLLVVGIAYLVYRTFADWPKIALARTPALYAIGTLAAYWSVDRIVSMAG